MTQILKLTNICKNYQDGNCTIPVLSNVNLALQAGEVVSLLGASGSGKSTLLNIMGLLDSPTSGSMLFNNVECSNLSDEDKALVRKNQIGFIFQFHHLLADFTAIENVSLPALINGASKSVAFAEAKGLMDAVGLSKKHNNFPSQLSGGERQRCAIARALINKPHLILADEPTGNLDRKLSEEVCNLIISLALETNACAIIVTHDVQVASNTNRKLQMVDGRLLHAD